MNAIVASNRLKSALRVGQGTIPEMGRTATWSGHTSFHPISESNQEKFENHSLGWKTAPPERQVTPIRNIAGEPVTLMIVVGDTSEEFDVQAYSSWNIAGLKELLGELLKADPNNLAVSFKRTVLTDGQQLDKIPFLRSGAKIICARLEEEKDD